MTMRSLKKNQFVRGAAYRKANLWKVMDVDLFQKRVISIAAEIVQKDGSVNVEIALR
jgi:hypothetical protein